MATKADKLLSTAQVAELKGCSDSLVRRHVRAGSLAAMEVGGMYLVRAADAAKFSPRKAGRPPKKNPKESP